MPIHLEMKPKAAMTLDRVLSRLGWASRTAAREAIRAGRLKVNGRVVRDPECWVQPEHDVVQLDGQRLKPARKIYLLFYKPKGVITSHGDPSGRKTVYDFLSSLGEEGKWVAPAGRLDKDTSGLLLLTNDTEFAGFVTSPESHVPKTYLVKASGLVSDETVARLNAVAELLPYQRLALAVALKERSHGSRSAACASAPIETPPKFSCCPERLR